MAASSSASPDRRELLDPGVDHERLAAEDPGGHQVGQLAEVAGDDAAAERGVHLAAPGGRRQGGVLEALQSARPGSLTCTSVSTSPGRTTASPTSTTRSPAASS
jgi:hypothetical protein